MTLAASSAVLAGVATGWPARVAVAQAAGFAVARAVLAPVPGLASAGAL
ncbi:MAG: hypothetical protein QOG94_3495 [Solirubrobacteraceae bacterium]|jgi:hypothetical protein|nr:hypothetical protein [Solirubrobacteraceae bacterium]